MHCVAFIPLYYITLHYIALRYVTLHYITVHYIRDRQTGRPEEIAWLSQPGFRALPKPGCNQLAEMAALDMTPDVPPKLGRHQRLDRPFIVKHAAGAHAAKWGTVLGQRRHHPMV